MRDFKGMKRQRGRNRSGGGAGGGAKPQNANRAFDSNGPEHMKIRGHAQHVFEKYQQLARDATSAGDRVLAENFLQHAEHYFRVLRTLQPHRPYTDFLSREGFNAGYDIDFEEEPQPEASGGEAQSASENGEGQPEQQGGEYQNRDNQNRDNQQNREGRWENRDGQRQDRDGYRNDRGDRQNFRSNNGQNGGQNGGQNNNGQRGYNRDNRDRYEGRDRDFGAQNGRDQNGRDQNGRDQNYRDQNNRDQNGGESAQREGGDRQGYNRDRSERRDRYDRDNNRADPLAMVEPNAEPLAADHAAPAEPSPMLRSEDGGVSHAPAFLQTATPNAPSGEDAPVKRPRGRPRKVAAPETEEV